jgi:hypothetical protein
MALCLAYFILSFLHYATLPEVDYLTDAVDEEVDGAHLQNRSAGLILMQTIMLPTQKVLIL